MKDAAGKKFDAVKSFETVLFIINSLGKEAGIQRIFSIVYLAERKLLEAHEEAITGDIFFEGKRGPIPLHFLYIYLSMRKNGKCGQLTNQFRKRFLINANGLLAAKKPADHKLISEQEANCLFEIIHACKKLTDESLESLVRQIPGSNDLVMELGAPSDQRHDEY